jgi:hypothetical protein
MRRLALLLAVSTAVVAAPAARASELASIAAEFEYRAAPGETNALQISTQGATVVISDPGATITVSAPFCSLADAHTVTCQITMLGGLPAPIPARISALLGDGDDSGVAVGNSMPITLHGEDGNDRLTVGEPLTPLQDGPVEAFGDAGEDQLAGADGREVLRGGAGNDTVSGGANGDLLDGGDGNDHLFGGPGTDRLDGGSGDDVLSGDADADRAAAGDGDDTVEAGDGDVADGGTGNDRIGAAGAAVATIGCSAGRDRVAPSRADRVAVSCESLERQVACHNGHACRIVALLATPVGRVLGSTTKRIRAGRSRTLELPLSRQARREVKRRKSIALVLRTKVLAGTVDRVRPVPLTIGAREPVV